MGKSPDWIRGMSGRDGVTPASDEALVERTRAGDRRAFGELWRRHYRSGTRVARQFTSIDADDLVAESYTRIFQRVKAGGGPIGAFRPYLYTTIRNLASSWGAARREVNVDDMAAFEDPVSLDDPATLALDRTLTAKAFRSLPERWQTVLWYTEIEGMDPHEIAPIMGMTANGVAALSYRAREGLRKAWLQAHISDAGSGTDCAWALGRMGEHARGALGARDGARMGAHLESCAKCSVISEEVEEVGSRLALVMIPLLLGGVAGGTLLATFNSAPAVAASASVPALPEAVTAGASAAAAGGAGLFGAATAPVALVSGLAIVVAATTGGVIALAPSTHDPTSASQQEHGVGPSAPTPDPLLTDPAAAPGERPRDGVGVESPVRDAVDGVIDDVGGLVDSVVGTITGEEPPPGHTAPGGVVGADIALNLSGTATPGAHLSLQAAGQVYATTTVAADGTFTLNATGIPSGLASLDLVQTVDRSYLAGLVGGGGLLGDLLGTLDELIDALIKPVQLNAGGGSISINPIG